MSKCRAFSGFGVALGGAKSGDKKHKLSDDVYDVDDGDDDDDNDDCPDQHDNKPPESDSRGLKQRTGEKTPNLAGMGAETTSLVSAVCSDGGLSRGATPAAVDDELSVGGVGAEKMVPVRTATGEVSPEDTKGRMLGDSQIGNARGRTACGEELLEGVMATITTNVLNSAVDAKPAETNEPRASGGGHEDGTVPCAFCGKSVPVVNRVTHELRCSAIKRTGVAGVRSQTGSEVASRFSNAKMREPSEIMREESIGSADWLLPSTASSTEGKKSEGSKDDPSTLQRRNDTQALPSWLPTQQQQQRQHPPPCSFCGLSFRTVDATDAHESLCGTRTERCGRCCGHISRRDLESHGRPGGACDAAIAAAVAREEHDKATVVAAAAAASVTSGMEFSGDGFGLSGSRGGLNGGMRSSVGEFNSLLAEAMKSSKVASATLEAARVRNDSLAMSLSGKALLHPRGISGFSVKATRSRSDDRGVVTRKSAMAETSAERPRVERVTHGNVHSEDVGTCASAAGHPVAMSKCTGTSKDKGVQGEPAQATSSA